MANQVALPAMLSNSMGGAVPVLSNSMGGAVPVLSNSMGGAVPVLSNSNSMGGAVPNLAHAAAAQNLAVQQNLAAQQTLAAQRIIAASQGMGGSVSLLPPVWATANGCTSMLTTLVHARIIWIALEYQETKRETPHKRYLRCFPLHPAEWCVLPGPQSGAGAAAGSCTSDGQVAAAAAAVAAGAALRRGRGHAQRRHAAAAPRHPQRGQQRPEPQPGRPATGSVRIAVCCPIQQVAESLTGVVRVNAHIPSSKASRDG